MKCSITRFSLDAVREMAGAFTEATAGREGRGLLECRLILLRRPVAQLGQVLPERLLGEAVDPVGDRRDHRQGLLTGFVIKAKGDTDLVDR